MFIKVILVTLCCGVLAENDYRCNQLSALLLLKRPAYEFSVRLLQRVSENTDAHFVYSPLSTWLQLTALAEGATGRTFREIWRVTKHHRNRCFRKKLSDIMITMNTDLKEENKRRSIIAIDKLMAVKKPFINYVENLYGIKVLLLDFTEPMTAASEVNYAIEEGTKGAIDRIVYYDDFLFTVLLLSDANSFHSAWKTQFNKQYTTKQPFYSSQGLQIGDVSMMNHIGNFHVSEFPHLGATVLELPFANHRISMLLFLQSNKNWVGEIFYRLQKTRLASIFNSYKYEGVKLVNVTMPRFEIQTEVDNLPELVYDMGIKRIFNPDLAELKEISNFKMFASLMSQVTKIKVNEEGITAETEFLADSTTSVNFVLNKPFSFMVIDKLTDFILYAGIYSVPSQI